MPNVIVSPTTRGEHFYMKQNYQFHFVIKSIQYARPMNYINDNITDNTVGAIVATASRKGAGATAAITKDKLASMPHNTLYIYNTLYM